MSVNKHRGRARTAVTPQEPLLSPHRAFVLQFYPEANVERGRFVGRVEHVVSGQASRFDRLDTLVAFLGRVLATVHTTPAEEQ